LLLLFSSIKHKAQNTKKKNPFMYFILLAWRWLWFRNMLPSEIFSND